MTTLTLYAAMADDQSLDTYFGAALNLYIPAPKRAEYGGANAMQLALRLRSDHFTYNDESSAVKKGVVDTATFYVGSDPESFELVAKMENVGFDFKTFNYEPPLNGQSLVMLFLMGKDTIKGSVEADVIHSYGGRDLIKSGGGDDFLYGGAGNDTLVGGAGSDRFYIGRELGADTIKDFDGDPSDGFQDFMYLSAQTNSVDVRQFGRNVIVDIEDGPNVILLNAKASQITEDDFVFV